MNANEFIIVILIPFIVSIIANICTSLFQRWLISLVTKSIRSANMLTSKLLKVRLRQIEAEQNEIQLFITCPQKLLDACEQALLRLRMAYWGMLFSPILGLLILKMATLFPSLFSSIFSSYNSNSIFVVPIYSVAGCALFPCVIYSSLISRRIQRMRDAKNILSRLNDEHSKLQKLLVSST
jgi:hypothetical protein